MRIAKYLRDHPELEQSPALHGRALLAPGLARRPPRTRSRCCSTSRRSETIDPALMAVLAERHWDDFGRRATEAWIYYGWAIFFDDKEVVGMVRRVSRLEPQYD